MTRKQKQIIIKQTEFMSDNELENLYYDSTYDCLGSQVEDMIELGYDKRDIERDMGVLFISLCTTKKKSWRLLKWC